MKRRRFSDWEKEIIKQMREDGYGYLKIAKRLGREKDVIGDYCRKNGLGGFRGILYDNNSKSIPDENKLSNTHPEIAKLFKYPEKAERISHGSNKKEWFICERCGHESQKIVGQVVNKGFSCSRCSDGLSYPEKFVNSLLNQLNVDFKNQMIFDWAYDKRYDFYIPSINCIIETHGLQHYKGSFEYNGGRLLEEEQENDRLKEKLAKENGVEHYIIIDCRKSELEWIKMYVLKSHLNHLFDLSIIKWLECHEFACNSIVKIACDLWNNGKNITEIDNILKISHVTTRKYIKMGNKLGWCTRPPNTYAEYKRSSISQITMNGELIKHWESSSEAAKHLGISASSIIFSCKGDLLSHGGYVWLYKEDYLDEEYRLERIYKAKSKIVVKLSIDGEFIAEYKGIRDASKDSGVDEGNLSATCRGKRKTAGGFRWMYKNDYEDVELLGNKLDASY